MLRKMRKWSLSGPLVRTYGLRFLWRKEKVESKDEIKQETIIQGNVPLEIDGPSTFFIPYSI